MDGTQTSTTDTQGTQTDTPVEGDDKPLSEFAKLKVKNDEFAKELQRGQELQAEANKLEAEKQLAGTSGGRVEIKTKDPKAYGKSIMAGKLPGKEDGK